jgi:hypothetical protein
MLATVACVLRSGGDYDLGWVGALHAGLRGVGGPDPRLVCLTDSVTEWSDGYEPMQHAWPGWWSKLELFRPGLFDGPVLYLDLDSLIIGDLSALRSYDGPLAMLSDFYKPARAQSGVMAWTPGELTESLWSEWTRDPSSHMAAHRGDGEWLHATLARLGIEPDRIQDLWPDQVVSYKVHARSNAPEGARVVCGHGNPRFNRDQAGWAGTRWRALRTLGGG